MTSVSVLSAPNLKELQSKIDKNVNDINLYGFEVTNVNVNQGNDGIFLATIIYNYN